MGKDGHQVYKYNLGLTAEERKDAGATLDKLGQYLKVILLLGVENSMFLPTLNKRKGTCLYIF